MIDDPQMLALIPLIKEARREVKISYRSHIVVGKELVAIHRSPQEHVWRWIWDYIKEVDVFMRYPVSTSVPYGVPLAMVGPMRAGTDWNYLLYPERESIAKIGGFDPSKGIPDVIDLAANLLNARITTAKILVQLSSRGGFEIKVPEALYYAKPVATTRTGGIPLQIERSKSGFLVDLGDTDSITNGDLYERMNNHAKASVSDEVGTVGNAACWLYLAATLDTRDRLKPDNRLIIDTVMEEVGQKYESGQPIRQRKGIDYKRES
ncbi:hypothetical protein HOY80DRAFT_1114694 [Tuber brumale]|nr:hypothetical protein HOY80DRAFT_1114694 [Tuber brumale]